MLKRYSKDDLKVVGIPCSLNTSMKTDSKSVSANNRFSALSSDDKDSINTNCWEDLDRSRVTWNTSANCVLSHLEICSCGDSDGADDTDSAVLDDRGLESSGFDSGAGAGEDEVLLVDVA